LKLLTTQQELKSIFPGSVDMSTTQTEIEKGSSEIACLILQCLSQNKGCLIGRNGTVELEVLLNYHRYKKFFKDQTFTLERNAGVFPQDEQALLQWIQETTEANKTCDILAAGWYAPLRQQELLFLNQVNSSYHCVPLRSLEPYYVPQQLRWTALLSDQRVGVVSSFTKTMEQQLKQRTAVWGSYVDSYLPDSAEFVFFQTGYSPAIAKGRAEWSPPCRTWMNALDKLEADILEANVGIVLIGCGGLGMPLAQRLKKKEKIVLVLGGAIQVLFGIKGERWKHHDVIGKLWNKAWIYPSPEETPLGASLIERSCYWQAQNSLEL
jgi:hypothetical protein